MDNIRELVKAGLKVDLSESTMTRLDKLTEEEVAQLVRICKKLSDKKTGEGLVYTVNVWSQPPHSRP